MSNEKAYTTSEVLVASVMIIILLACCLGVYITINLFYQSSIAEYNLQRNANGAINKMIRGLREGSGTSSGTFGLRSGRSFSIPAAGEVDFVGTDGNTRRYYLSGRSIVYDSPTWTPHQQNIYTAPAGASITLRFWEPGGYSDHETIGIYVSLSERSGNRTVSGSLSTYANLRNMPK